MSRMKAAASLCLAVAAAVLASAPIGTEDVELRDLDVTGWDCANQMDGSAKTQDGIERNRMKNRWLPGDLSAFTVDALDTAAFLKKVGQYDSRLQSKRRSELTAAQKGGLDKYENQIVSLIGWLVLAYAGPPETTNCGDATLHAWPLELFENPSDTPRKSAIQLELSVRLHRGQSNASTVTAYGFNRSLDSSAS